MPFTTENRCKSGRPAFMPSPEEIREACAEIRSEWDEETEQKRNWTTSGPWLPPGAEMEPTIEHGGGTALKDAMRHLPGGKCWKMPGGEMSFEKAAIEAKAARVNISGMGVIGK